MLTRLTPDRLAFVVSTLFLVTASLGLVLGSPAAFRTPHIAVAVAMAFVALRAPRTFEQPLGTRAWQALAASSLVWCALVAWSHWASFRVNGVDFSIFDWMLESTHEGRIGFSPIYAENHFGVHSTFVLLLLVPLHALAPSPLWLVGVGAGAIWAGIFPLRRLSRAALGPHGGLEVTLVLAWLGSAWLGNLLNNAFRIESLAPVFTLWFLVGWVEKRPAVLLGAVVAMLCTKEDAALALACFSLAILVGERARWRAALALLVAATAWVLVYSRWLQPALLGHPAPGYLGFWSDFGQTPPEIIRGMLSSPWQVLRKLASSSWYLFFGPLLLLPFLSLRGAAGLFPTFFLIGVANFGQMHEYEGYYPSPMVPWALFAMVQVAARFQRRRAWWLAAIAGLLAFPLFHADYARTMPIDWAIRAGLPGARAALAQPASVRCVQTALMPHVGYPAGTEPVFDHECLDQPGAAGLLNSRLERYPQTPEQFDENVARWRAAGRASELPGGFIYVAPTGLEP